MRKKVFSTTTLCVTCLVLGSQAQSSSGGYNGSNSTSSNQFQPPRSRLSATPSLPPLPPTYPLFERQFAFQRNHLSPTGRLSPQEARATKFEGAQIKSTSGDILGTIKDLIVIPSSGRIDFAVISSRSTTGANASSSTSGATNSMADGQLVPVPWSLLRPSNTNSSTGASTEQLSFVFIGDTRQLQEAPSFSESNRPDISQMSWRRGILSCYGKAPGAATGGAQSPGGTSAGSGESSSSSLSSSSEPGSSSLTNAASILHPVGKGPAEH